MLTVLPVHPMPELPSDVLRWRLTATRERMMTGDWYEDLRTELEQFFAPQVLARMTHPDTTRNPQKTYNVQKNVLYDESPTVSTQGEAVDLSAILKPELWPLRQRSHLLTLGLRESLMRLDWYEGIGVSYRVVSPAWCIASARPERPDMPVSVQELRPRMAPEGEVVWTWETWDVSDPTLPVYRIERIDPQTGRRVDVSEQYRAGEVGYPYLDTAGAPILPYILFHAQITDQLWNWEEQRELVDGTLKVGALWTLWFHGVRDCSHPQRYGLDVEAPSAVSTSSTTPVDKIALDQSSILLLTSRKEKSGSLNTLAPAMDPKSMAEAIVQYEAGLAQEAGISPADLQVGGTSGMSGYAIVVSRDGLRRAWRAQQPAAAMGDALLLATAARLVNAYGTATGTQSPPLPESATSYAVTYAEVGRTPDEIMATFAQIDALAAKGLAGPLDVVQHVYPSLGRDGAIEKLIDIRRQQAELDAALEAAGFGAAPVATAADGPRLTLAPTDVAVVVTVDEARASQGLPPFVGTEGGLTITEYKAKNAGVVAEAAAAVAGVGAIAPADSPVTPEI